MPDPEIDTSASIFLSVKKLLGIDAAYDVFDVDIIMYVNSALADLSQIGLGPDNGFEVTGDTELWDDFLAGDPRLNQAKAFVAQKTRLAFDPPATSFGIQAIEKQLEEKIFRLSVTREGDSWQKSTTPTDSLPITV